MKTLKLFLATLMVSGLSFESNSQVFTSDDITALLTTTGSNDSTSCTVTGSVMYELTIENSFLNDTIKIKEQSNGYISYINVNSTGQNPWVLAIPGNTQIMSDANIIGNMAYFFTQPTKITTLHDTLYNIQINFQVPVSGTCAYGNVSGRVYVDMNSDCIYNAGDQDLNQIWVKSIPAYTSSSWSSNLGASTSPDGTYSVNMQQSWLDHVDVSIPAYLSFIFPPATCSPNAYSFTSIPQSNVDFALQCTNNVDATASIGSNGVVRPNIPFFLYPGVSNTGCDAASGTLKLVLDPDVNYDAAQSSNPALLMNGDTLYWNFSNLTNLSAGAYWNSFFAGIHLTPTLDVNIGDTLCFKVITSIPSADFDPTNNITEICLPVVNSYDPNMKEVMPKGEGIAGNIPIETEKLRYTIHFQNTGNAVAYNVSILDTLSNNLIPSSVKILDASHNMVPEWVSPGVLKFNFYNIMLADSNSNEPASHGFVTFEVAITDGINYGETIENTGHIYFDFNPAIVTNTALNTIHQTLSNKELNQLSISIQPNPASDKVSIIADDIQSVSVIDFSGKEVIKSTVLQNQLLDVSTLPNGLYIIQVVTAKGIISEKLLIRK